MESEELEPSAVFHPNVSRHFWRLPALFSGCRDYLCLLEASIAQRIGQEPGESQHRPSEKLPGSRGSQHTMSVIAEDSGPLLLAQIRSKKVISL